MSNNTLFSYDTVRYSSTVCFKKDSISELNIPKKIKLSFSNHMMMELALENKIKKLIMFSII